MREDRISDGGLQTLRTRSVAMMTRHAGLVTLIAGSAALGLIFLSNDVRWVWTGTALLAGLDLFFYVQLRARPGAHPNHARSLLLACLIAVLAGLRRAAALGAFR